MPKQIEYLTIDEIKSLLNAIDDIRDIAIITLFINTGIFLHELTNLTIDSIDWDNKLLKIEGARDRNIPLNEQALESLAKWSQERLDSTIACLFVTGRGKVKGLSRRAIDKKIRKYALIAGIRRRVNSLILRNTFAVRLFQEGMSKDKAANILGITDSSTINRYAKAAKLPPAITSAGDILPESDTLSKLDTRPKLTKLIATAFPAKPKQGQVLDDANNISYPSPEFIFGRDSAVNAIKSCMSRNQSILIKGALGTGKTHLLKHVAAFSSEIIYIPSPSPVKNMLNQVWEHLDPEFDAKSGSRLQIKDIIDNISKVKGTNPRTIIIDNLNLLRTADVEPFLFLFDNFTIIASTDELSPKLKQIWWKFQHFELKPLKANHSKELIKHLTRTTSVTDYEMLETKILNLSNGLPMAIVDMIRRLRGEHVVNKEAIRAIYHEAGIQYRDWTGAIMVLWAMAVAFRFFSLGTHSFEGYIIAGFGSAFFMVLRFFIFKMR